MPPKKTFNRDDSDDEDDSSTATTSSEDEVAPTRQSNNANSGNANNGAAGRGIANKPHDEEFDAGHDEGVRTPPGETLQRRPPGATTQATVTPAGKAGGGTVLRNNPNDETFDVEDDDERVRTPPQRGNNVPPPAAGGQRGGAPNAGRGGTIQNNPHDYYEEAGDEGMETPPRQNVQPTAGKKPSNLNANAIGNRQLQNDTHDEAIDVSDNSQGTPASTYGSATPQSRTKHNVNSNDNLINQESLPIGGGGGRQTLAPQGKMSMAMGRGDESSSEEEDDDAASIGGNASGGHSGGGGLPQTVASLSASAKTTNKPPPTQEYNPADYASINQRASREMQELFMTIAQYQPQVQELPSKLRPFIPDFIPSVGDLDPFCKVPRPDARPDNFGLTVVDEPSANQSNPAVVSLYMKHITRGSAPSVFVESVEDASNRPNVVDKWIADIKDLHYKKPLPTVNYSKVMPEIESLLQAWSPEFEELLNSDLQFPPTQVDLDIDQYVRVMCAVLDIPTYGTLVESLHVMFTLYCEFRANQHFQHA